MQLDIFEHSRDVMLRNAALDALRSRDAAASARAIAMLAAEYRGDPLLPALDRLCGRLRLSIQAPLTQAAAQEFLRATEDTVADALQVFGGSAGAWLSPLWLELARAAAHLPFDPERETLHAAALLLRGGDWAEAGACVDTIPSWRRQPAPLSWKVQAECRGAGLAAAWPLLAELSWMAP